MPVLKYRLGVPLVTDCCVCSDCKLLKLDSYDDHAVQCAAEVGTKRRHDIVRDVLVGICGRIGVLSKKEVALETMYVPLDHLTFFCLVRVVVRI